MIEEVSELHKAYYDAKAADDAYQAELVIVYGDSAGDARYVPHLNAATPKLKQLQDLWKAAEEKRREASQPRIALENRSGEVVMLEVTKDSRLAKLPKPTNKQSRLLIQRMVNRLALATVRTCRTLHSCTFCGCDIVLGDTYRDKGYGARAHDFCFQAVAREYKDR